LFDPVSQKELPLGQREGASDFFMGWERTLAPWKSKLKGGLKKTVALLITILQMSCQVLKTFLKTKNMTKGIKNIPNDLK
jgi:hypothetical protein